jgi:hypothetical protein
VQRRRERRRKKMKKRRRRERRRQRATRKSLSAAVSPVQLQAWCRQRQLEKGCRELLGCRGQGPPSPGPLCSQLQGGSPEQG